MLREIKVEDMIGNLEGRLGDDDYSEPLEILINSANNHNKFNLYGAFAFKNQLKDRPVSYTHLTLPTKRIV